MEAGLEWVRRSRARLFPVRRVGVRHFYALPLVAIGDTPEMDRSQLRPDLY